MSMAIVLAATRDRLRTEISALDANTCGIQPQGLPPAKAGKLYVSIDEDRVVSEVQDNMLKERYGIVVYVCREGLVYPSDMRGLQYLQNDPYLAGIATLEQLERSVIVALHGRYELMAEANTLGGFPDADAGDVFQEPLWSVGRGNTSLMGDQNGKDRYVARPLRFFGMRRVQALDIVH